MTFGEKLQALRKSQRLSQEELAAKLNVTRQAVSKWESGAMADVENLVKLSRFFQCSIDYLVKDEINDSVESYVKSKHKVMNGTTIAWISASGSVFVLLVLYIISRFIKTPIGIKNHETGMVLWNGFREHTFYGLIMEYNLHMILYVCLITWIISTAFLTFHPLIQGAKWKTNKFAAYRITAFVWTMLATSVWYYISTRTYLLDIGADGVILVVIYALVLFILLWRMQKHRV